MNFYFRMFLLHAFKTLLIACGILSTATCAEQNNTIRHPTNEDDLRYWLENMVVYHRFSIEEMRSATGLSQKEIGEAIDRFGLAKTTVPALKPGELLRVLPYPGGRHPRIGFLEGAIDPQRDTKVSIFAPWDNSYVVLDVPEAIWSHLGLTYLAHTHLDTIWTRKGITLPPQEWQREAEGVLQMRRELPNGIAFGTRLEPRADGVLIQLSLANGLKEPLKQVTMQVCLMLKAAAGFNSQTDTNKVFSSPYAAVCADGGERWIILAFEPCHRTWGNEQVPCIHSDPKFPELKPGESHQLRGWFSFYEGKDVAREFRRLDGTGWRHAKAP